MRQMVEPDSEQFHKLWQACLDKVDEIDRESKANRTNNGTMRTPAWLATGRQAVMCKFVIFQNDGRQKMHLVEAGMAAFPRDADDYHVEVHVWWSDNDRANQQRLDDVTKHPDKFLIVNHKFYSLGPGNAGGFGGRKVRYQRADALSPTGYGPIRVTHDLWYGGPIAPAWRDRLPDNTVFLDGFDGPTVMY